MAISLVRAIYLIYLLHFLFPTTPLPMKRLCLDDERAALLEFNHSMSLNQIASTAPNAYPKTASWRTNIGTESDSNDCCSWDGVECNENSGHVIGLDLSSSFLYGSINSSCSLFKLVHLQRINLGDNDFIRSEIPSGIGRLLQLRALNLSYSDFSGQIPREISELTELAYLDLSKNSLLLQHPGLEDLIRNLTKLEQLNLSGVDISSEVPEFLANLTSLTSLVLQGCGLNGEFPKALFNLPKLQVLSVSDNRNLTGFLPDFSEGNSLMELILSHTSFSGPLPLSLNNLKQLTAIDLGDCGFVGSIPSLANLSRLTFLALSSNNFEGGNVPDWVGKLTGLTYLYLEDCNLHGEIPYSLSALVLLRDLNLQRNQLIGRIPSFLMNLTELTALDLSSNQLHGQIPDFSILKNLEFIGLEYNNLSGTMDADMFLGLANLKALQLTNNQITFLDTHQNFTNSTLPKLQILGLANCNLRAFPGFLHYQDEMIGLFLEHNQIEGLIPEWLWNSSRETMQTVSLSNNLLTGFEQNPRLLPWTRLKILNLEHNMLQGVLPIPPPTTTTIKASSNRLAGEISPLFCTLNSLGVLDLSSNDMTGVIPPCLSNFSSSLTVLNLQGNNFLGAIPDMFTRGSKLKMISFRENRLEGKVPRSLANCAELQILDLGYNLIDDTFPSWLGALSRLQVLILRSNKFHGELKLLTTTTNSFFPMLHIVDLSNNGFSGEFPGEFFESWAAMKNGVAYGGYMQADVSVKGPISWNENYSYAMVMVNKGITQDYPKILNIFAMMDLSSNKFTGKIPESFGSLRELIALNLSNNGLSGNIPPSLGNLARIESIDLSKNKLSGVIPHELVHLGWLEFLNVSCNNLTGPIPEGKQFDTFQRYSYMNNPGLCGKPLPEVCNNNSHTVTIVEVVYAYPTHLFWVVVLLGLMGGLVVGAIIGLNLTTRHEEWFVKKFGRKEEEGEEVDNDEGEEEEQQQKQVQEEEEENFLLDSWEGTIFSFRDTLWDPYESGMGTVRYVKEHVGSASQELLSGDKGKGLAPSMVITKGSNSLCDNHLVEPHVSQHMQLCAYELHILETCDSTQ